MAVIWQPRLDNFENIKADWTALSPYYPNQLGCINPQFVRWEEYGLDALRVESQHPGNNFDNASIMTWHEFINEATRQVPHEVGTIKYGPAMGTTAERELYCIYGLRIDPDVAVGMTEIGVKLPGFEGFGYSARMWHGRPVNGKVPLFLHWYGATHPVGGGSAENIPTNVSVTLGEVFWVRQRIKQNTVYLDRPAGLNGQGDQTYEAEADGAVEVWIGPDKVLSFVNLVINNTGLGEILKFFQNIYHGGVSLVPSAPIHYEFAGVAIGRTLMALPALVSEPQGQAMSITLTAENQGYYTVYKNGVAVSNHTTEREAIEVAVNLELANPQDVVTYQHDYSVKVEAQVVDPEPPPPDPDPPPPPPPPPTGQAVLTRNIATQDATGHSHAPNFSSVHLLPDGKIAASFGDTGIHTTEESWAVQIFDPATETMQTARAWEQQVSSSDPTLKIPPGGGYNRFVSTYDNHPSFYWPQTNALIWAGHGVFDRNVNEWIRGNRPPMTEGWSTYATGHPAFGNVYNPVYLPCPDLGVVAFMGRSIGGEGGWTTLVIWEPGPDLRPVAKLYDLGFGCVNARNNGACIGNLAYLGGGITSGTVNVSNSVFTFPNHGYQDGFEFYLLHDNGQGSMPSGITYAQTYYVIDATQNTFRLSATPGGSALTVGDVSAFYNMPSYKMRVIDLTTRSHQIINNSFGMGVADHYPQLMRMNGKLLLVGKKVSEYDPSTNQWSEVPVQGWPEGGFKTVCGAPSNGKIYFRGWPVSGPSNGFPEAFQWNRIQF